MTSFVEELGAEKLHYLAGQLEECVVQTLMENLWGREMDQLALAATTRIVEDATLARAAPPIPASLRL
jgi:hypothetical protein